MKNCEWLPENDIHFLEPLGTGVSSKVIRALNFRTNKYLALKYFKNMDRFHLKDILFEDLIMQKLQSIEQNNFLEYYGIFKDPTNINGYILMLESGVMSMDELLQSYIKEKFNEREILFIIRSLAEDFLKMQKKGIANRDVKPDNIIIVKKENQYSFKITDFGIGYILQPQNQDGLIDKESILGVTIGYQAPEIKKNDPWYDICKIYDPFKADVYSLGVILKKLIQRNGLNREVSPHLFYLSKKMTEVDVKERFDFSQILFFLNETNFENDIDRLNSKIEKIINEKKEYELKFMSDDNFFEKKFKNFSIYMEVSKFKESEDYLNQLEERFIKNKDSSQQNLGIAHYADLLDAIASFSSQIKGDYPKAEKFYLKCLEILKEVFDERNPELIGSYNNLGYFYEHIIQDFKKAEGYYEHALSIQQEHFGEMDEYTATLYDNLASLHGLKNDHEICEKFLIKSLNIRIELFSENHMETTKSYYNLARYYQEIKQDYQKSEELLLKCLNIRIHLFGEFHKETIEAYNVFANFCKEISENFKKAEEIDLKVLAIKIELYGESNVETAFAYNNLALFYAQTMRNTNKADEYYMKSLSIIENFVSERNIEKSAIYNNLAQFYQQAKGDHAKAEEFYLKSLEIRVAILGENHVTASSYYALAEFYHKNKIDYNKAEQFYLKNLDINKKCLGDDHTDIASNYIGLASFYKEIKKEYDKTENFLFLALKIRSEKLGI